MKKFLAALLTLTLIFGAVAAFAEPVKLYPFHNVDMETYGTYDTTVRANIVPWEIDEENNILFYDVYDVDYYSAEQVRALQPGDIICAAGGDVEVKTVDEWSGGFYINDGLEGSVDMWQQQYGGDTLICYSENEQADTTLLGRAGFAFADEVTVATFRWTKDGEASEEYDVAVLPASEVKGYLISLSERSDGTAIEFTYQNFTKVTLRDGKVAEIMVQGILPY